MALTPQEAENKYIEKLCDIFKTCEPYIDKILVDNFCCIKEDKQITMYRSDIFPPSVDKKFLGPLAILMEEKYSGWDFIYNNEEQTFTFKLKNKDQILLNLIDEANKRFELLDIRKPDEEHGEEPEVEGYDIPF